MSKSFDFRGKTALITGASSGIGRAFAYALAERGAKLVLVARSHDKLRDLAAELRRDYACNADFLTVDLGATDAVQTIDFHLKAAGIMVDVLINNAGFAAYGHFETIPLTRQRDEVLVNCIAAIELTHLLLPGMQARSDGAVINVASTAAFQPDPYMAVYGATKAFLLSFSEAIWAENDSAASALSHCVLARRKRRFSMLLARRRQRSACRCRSRTWCGMPCGRSIAIGAIGLWGRAIDCLRTCRDY